MNSPPAGPFDVILTCNYSPWSRYSGGAQKSVHMLATAMASLGLRVCVLFSKAPWEKADAPADLPYAVKWVFFVALRPGISSPLRFLNGLFFLFAARSLCSSRTVLHGNGDEAALLHFVRRRGPFLYTCRYPNFDSFLKGFDWSRPSAWLKVICREPRFAAMALGMRNADVVTCTSGYSREQVAACFGLSKDRCIVVPNGLDSDFLAARYREEGQKGILYFGRLTFAKGVDLLLEAYAGLNGRLRAEHPLTVIGEGPFKKDLQAKALKLGVAGSVRFPGWMAGSALVDAILAHRLAALPSREESFGNTMVEVLATGQTLITSDAGSIPEVTGSFGVKVASGDAVALAQALDKELRSPWNSAESERQRIFVSGRYSWEASARAFMKLYGINP